MPYTLKLDLNAYQIRALHLFLNSFLDRLERIGMTSRPGVPTDRRVVHLKAMADEVASYITPEMVGDNGAVLKFDVPEVGIASLANILNTEIISAQEEGRDGGTYPQALAAIAAMIRNYRDAVAAAKEIIREQRSDQN